MKRFLAIILFLVAGLALVALAAWAVLRSNLGAFGVTSQFAAVVLLGVSIAYSSGYLGWRLWNSRDQSRLSILRRTHWFLGWSLIAVIALACIARLAAYSGPDDDEIDQIALAVVVQITQAPNWPPDAVSPIAFVVVEDDEPSLRLLRLLNSQGADLEFRSLLDHAVAEASLAEKSTPSNLLDISRIDAPFWRTAVVRAAYTWCTSEYLLVKTFDRWRVIGSDVRHCSIS